MKLTVAGKVMVAIACVVAAVAGWFGVSLLRGGGDAVSAADAVNLYTCPFEGARTVGQLFPGDEVWVIGRSGDRWAVVRDPAHADRAVWVPLASLHTPPSLGALPEIGCEADPATATTAPIDTSVGTTIAGATTTTVLFDNASTTSSSTSTTISGDRTAPSVSISANRPFLTVSPSPSCPDKATMEVTITVADPSLPLTIRSITASWNVNGPQSAGLSPVGGNRFQLVVLNGGPASGEVPMTLTATATDGAGNVGTGTLLVTLRAAGACG